jgi:hypothetical protein
LDNLQTALAFVVLVGLVFVYRGFLGSMLRFLADHPSQAAILVVLYAIVYGQFGNALGIPYLFWNEEPVTRLLAAVEATLLLATIGITAYFWFIRNYHSQILLRRKLLCINELANQPTRANFASWIASIFSLKNSMSLNPYAWRFIVLILLFVPSIGPLEIITS